jgi:hypothetical protein
MILSVIAFFYLMLWRGDRVDVSTFIFGSPFMFVLNALIGIYLAMSISYWIGTRSKSAIAATFVFLGERTVPIMAFQYLGFQIGHRVWPMYGFPQLDWVFAAVFGIAVPVMLSMALSAVRIDSRRLSFMPA